MKRFAMLLIAAGLMAACGSGASDVARGRQVFSEHCVACHSLSPEVVIVGPALAGVATRAAANSENLRPREVLRRAILSPQAEIVEGFADLMPPDFEQKLVEADLEALLSYLMTLE
ncbi:MAG: c-type cytochrome [Anaerolineales bacterium]